MNPELLGKEDLSNEISSSGKESGFEPEVSVVSFGVGGIPQRLFATGVGECMNKS